MDTFRLTTDITGGGPGLRVRLRDSEAFELNRRRPFLWSLSDSAVLRDVDIGRESQAGGFGTPQITFKRLFIDTSKVLVV